MYPPPSRYHTLYGDMRLFILIISCFLGITGSSRCMYQMGTRTVQSGGSVTIPCSYSVPEELAGDVQIIWTETDGALCLSTNRRIFSPSGNVIEKYNGRLYREKDPNRNWMEYIKITGLKTTDGPRFCCQLYDNKNVIEWNKYGTLLLFPDYVTQLDELMAVTGGEVIIPCYHSKGTSNIMSVSWFYTDRGSNLCTDIPILDSTRPHENSRYSHVNFPQDISLRIRDVHPNDHRSYCCAVSTAQDTLLSNQFTRLIIADYQSSWDDPTEEISVEEGGSVTLTCSYTPPSGRYTERDIVRVTVYWRMGNVTGPYAYHPYQEMVHSTYIHQTSITGMTHLMIHNVMKADNTSFHCFVVIKLCAGDNQYEENIQYGGGTRLIISGRDITEPPRMSNISQGTLILAAYVGVKVLLAIILVALGCIYVRSKNIKRSTRKG